MKSPNAYGLVFDHLGLLASNPDSARRFLQGLGYKIADDVFDPLQDVHLALCTGPDMPTVEIVHPATDGHPLHKLLARNGNGLVYHMCYSAANADSAIDAIEADGLRLFCISPPKQAVLFCGKEVSFYMIQGFGLIEIIDEGRQDLC